MILICTDKFRGSLDAAAVGEALKKGLMARLPNEEIVIRALADGGEGTFEVLTAATDGTIHTTRVWDAAGEWTDARYGYAPHTRTAFIEMAQASGLAQLPKERRNPMQTHTFGTGQLIRASIDHGAQYLVMGIGGSATNDAGMGMACALGYRFLDNNGHELAPCGANLAKVTSIDNSGALDIGSVEVQVACDVDNPLFGTQGAAHVYAPQKGATPDMVTLLDEGLQHFSGVVAAHFGRDLAQVPGAGAAGGLGFGAMAFLNATLAPGIDLVMEHTRLEAFVQRADCIITGEGKIDTQTLSGKVVAGVARLAQVHQKPVIAICGTLELSAAQVQEAGLWYAESILNRPMTLEEAQHNAADMLCDWAMRFGGLWHLGLSKR
jgi:glycerate 2-kinase